MQDAYEAKQGDLDRKYIEAYKSKEFQEWVDSLTPEERAEARRQGLLEPHLDGQAGGVSTCDLAESPLASYDPRDSEEDVEPSESTMSPVDDERIWEVMRTLIGELKAQRNPGFSIDCLALVSGIVYDGYSQQDIARRHGITRAAVSKRCVELCNALRLKPSRAMRTMEAREAYARARNASLGRGVKKAA